MKGQALAIAMVVAAGVAMYVMYQSTFASLSETRRVYYERQRFARRLRLAQARAPARRGGYRGHPGRLGDGDTRGVDA